MSFSCRRHTAQNALLSSSSVARLEWVVGVMTVSYPLVVTPLLSRIRN